MIRYRKKFPFFTHYTPANVSDDADLVEILTQNVEYFKSKPVNIEMSKMALRSIVVFPTFSLLR